MKNQTKAKVPIENKMLLTVNEAAEYSNIGTSKIREMANRARCPFVFHNGSRVLIKRKEFESFISNQIEI